MSASLQSDASYGLYLGEPTSGSPSLRAMVARHLGLDIQSLNRSLAAPGAPVLRGLPEAEAMRLRTLLQATGWPASVLRESDHPTTDLSLQLSVWAEAGRLSARLARLLGEDPSAIRATLERPGGLVLAAEDPRRAALSQGALRPLRGLTLISADPQTALYDIFPLRPIPPERRARIARLLQPLALPACGSSGALAEGLPGPLRDRAMARLDPAEAVAVNRAFQRFELHLIGVSGWVGSDLADFLALRTGQPRARFEVISPADPVVLDTALTHGLARRFCADYAAIGLFTRLHLRGLPRNIDNPIR